MICARCGNPTRPVPFALLCRECYETDRRAQAHPRALPQVGLPWAPEPKPVQSDLFPKEG